MENMIRMKEKMMIMKKILIPVIALLFSFGAVAQTSSNRTNSTKVSDALAVLPAQNEKDYKQYIGDLISTGSEGLDMLTGMFTTVNNVPVNYALQGWAVTVSASGVKADKETFSQGIIKALDKASNREVKQFYMTLLGLAGGRECVPALASYLGGELTDPALAALVSIGGEDAKTAIAKAAADGKGKKVTLAKAIGDAYVPGQEDRLISWLAGADTETTHAIYYALSRTGGMKSLPVLKTAVAKADYYDDDTKAVEAYVNLLSRFALEKHAVAETKKEAAALNDKARNKKQYNTALGGFDVYCAVAGKEAFPRVLKAMESPSRYYRVGVLNIAEDMLTEKDYKELLAKAGKLKSGEAKADIISFAGESGNKNLTPEVTPYIGNANDEVNIAAMYAASALGGAGVPKLLVGQLTAQGSSEAVVKAAKGSLAMFDGNINEELGNGAMNGTVAGRTAAIDLLARRRAVEKSQSVIALAGDADKDISKAAYAALPSVVSKAERAKVYAMLDEAADADVAQVQKAVTATFAGEEPEKMSADIKKHMDSSAKPYRYLVLLAASGDKAMLDIITDTYKKGGQQEKKEALNALLRWDGMEAADYIYDIAESEKSKEALDGYITLATRSKLTREMKVIMLTDAMSIAEDPAQKQKILVEAGKLPIFQSLVLAGEYLDDKNADVQQRAAEAVMNIALANKSLYGPAITDLLKKASAKLNGPDSQYQKEAISKHIAGLPKEGGYVSIFNGKDLTGWKGLVKNPIARSRMSAAELAAEQVKADEIMRNGWKVIDGEMVFTGKGNNICTEKQYGDFEMYVDWKLYPDGPDSDAGVYLRGSPQVQMWDISRTNVGAQVGSGGLYNNSVNPKNPTKVADNTLGKWNTFYIKMVGERVTVILNGEKVVDNVILENYWNRKQPIFPVEQIELQAHGTRVGYRNIYINELPRMEPYTLSAEEEKEGYEVLFDGVSMHKWKGNTKGYVAEDGVMAFYPSEGGSNLYTKEEYGDFIFRFEYMLTPGCNNGLAIRTPDKGDAAYVGMEIQILDDDAPIYANLDKWQYNGSIYGVIAAKRGAEKPLGEWNYQEVYAKGDHIRITLNGEVIVDGDIRKASAGGTLDGKEHPGLLNKSGYIGFLSHNSPVKFKNIRIKKL